MAPLLEIAESAGAPLAQTCSVLDEMQAMQRKVETAGREGEGGSGRRSGKIDIEMEGGR